ncbi:MAG: hypothetical protein IJQ11_03810 [Bacteroidales bacterium]|nr:hypothetical protein [Bacteroidales bacterium]
MNLLDSYNDTYALFNYPIQNEVVKEGSFLSLSSSTQNKYDPLYASIPIGDVLPNVPYRVIDTLYDPDEEQFDLTIVSYVLTGNANQLGIKYMGKDLTISTLPQYLDLPESTRFNLGYYPEGILKVENTDNHYDPVCNTTLLVVRFCIPYKTYTDDTGHFRLNKKMYGQVTLRSTWKNKNNDYIIRKSWNEMLGIVTSDAICNMNKNTSGQDHMIRIPKTNSHLWYKAIVNNALCKYNKYMDTRGVSGVHNNANIWVIATNNGNGGAAPLAKKYSWAISYNGVLSGWLQYLAPITYPIVTQFNLLFRKLYPDIVLTISNTNKNVEEIDRILFHEAGHFSHGAKAGGSFWCEFVRREFENIVNNPNSNPYQDGTKPSIASGQLIALCEGWADFCGYALMSYYYNLNFYSNLLENYTMRTTPSILNDEIGSEYKKNFWFLSGLFWDIVDNAQETNSTRIDGLTGAFKNTIIDNLSIDGLDNLSHLYNCLTSSTKNGGQLKAKLITNHADKTSQINELFTSYGY